MKLHSLKVKRLSWTLILVKDDEFLCAKFVMAAHSPMLRAMLTSNMAEVAKQEIKLNHINKDIMQIILDYMHCENMSVHKDQLMDLAAAADYLQMTELKEMCLNEVPDILERSNVIEWWKEAAKMTYSNIKNQCEKIMAADFSVIAQQTDFLNLELDDVKHYTTSICRDTVTSDNVLDRAMGWVNYKEERIMHLEDILKSIRLSQCSSEGLTVITETYESLFDKVPIVYKLLNMITVASRKSKTISNAIVIVGGQVGNDVNRVCWKVDHSDQITQLCDIPVDDLEVKFSVCVIPQGCVITGGADKRLCMMFMLQQNHG